MKKKKIGLILGAAFMLAPLAACSFGGEASSTTTPEVPTTSNVTPTTTEVVPTTEVTPTTTEVAPTTTTVDETFTLKNITVTLDKEEYYLGDRYIPTVVAAYTSSIGGADKTETVTDWSIKSIKDANGSEVKAIEATGTYTITIEYQGKEASVALTVVPYTYSSLEDAVYGATEKMDLINAGTYSVDYGYYQEKHSYTFGDGFTVYKEIFSEDDYSENYIVKNGKEVVSVVKYSGQDPYVASSYELTLDDLLGYKVDADGDYKTDGYGPEMTLDYLYELQEEALVFSENTLEGGYSFSEIVVTTDNSAYVKLDVEFKTGVFGEIQSLKVTKSEYGMNDISIVDGVATISETAEPSVTVYEFTQTTGLRLAKEENPYAIDKISITDFTITIGDEAIDYSDVTYELENSDLFIDTKEGHRQKVAYNVAYKDGENALGLDSVDIFVTGTGFDGTKVDTRDINDYKYAIANPAYDSDALNCTFMLPGEYVVHFKSIAVEKTIKVTVKQEAPYDFDVQVYEELTKNSAFANATEYEMYPTNTIYVKPVIADKFVQDVTVTADSDKVTITKETLSLPEGRIECYKVTATETGTYTIKVASTKNADRYETLTVNVIAAPNVADLLTEAYEANYGGVKYAVVFTPESEGATAGTFTITDKEDATKAETLSFSYANGSFVAIHQSGENYGFDLSMNVKYKLGLVKDDNFIVLTAPAEDISEDDLYGEYTCTIPNFSITYTITIDKDHVTSTDGNRTEVSTYEINDNGEFTLTMVEGKTVLGGTLVYKDGKLTYTLGDNTYACKSKGGAKPVDHIPTAFVGTWSTGSSDIVITADTVTYNGSACTFVSATTESLTVHHTDWDEDITLTLVDAEKINDGFDDFTKQKDKLPIPSYFIGTWVSIDGDVTTIVTITDTEITIDGEAYEFVSATDDAVKVTLDGFDVELSVTGDGLTDGTLTFLSALSELPKDALGNYSCDIPDYGEVILKVEADQITDTDYQQTMKIAYILDTVDGYSVVFKAPYSYMTVTICEDELVYNGDTYTKKHSITILDKYIGKWADPTEPEFYWLITADSVTDNWMSTFKILSCDEDGLVLESEDEITLTVNGDTLNDGLYDYKKVTEAEDDVDEHGLKTSWYGTYTNEDGSFSFTISAAGIDYMDYVYTEITVTGTNMAAGMGLVNLDVNEDGTITDHFDEAIFTKKVEEEDTVDAHGLKTSWYGTYTNEDGSFSFTISAAGIEYSGDLYTDLTVEGNNIVSGFMVSFTVNEDGTITDHWDEAIFTKADSEPEEITIPEAFFGIWTPESTDNGDVELTITEDRVYDDYKDYTIVSLVDGALTIKSGYVTLVLTIEDGKLKQDNFGDISFYTLKIVKKIPTDFIGTWGYSKGEVSSIITISDEKIIIEDEEYEFVSSTEDSITVAQDENEVVLTLTEDGNIAYGEYTYVSALLSMPDALVGTYTMTKDETVYTIKVESSVIVNVTTEENMLIYYIHYTENGYEVVFDDSYSNIACVVTEDGSLVLNEVTYTKEADPEPEEVVISEEFIGTWEFEDNGYTATIIITADSMADPDGNTATLVSLSDGELTVKWYDVMTMTYTIVDGELKENNSGYVTTYTKKTASSDDTPTVTIDETFVGKWVDGSFFIEITSTTVTNEVDSTFKVVSCADGKLICELDGVTHTFTVSGTTLTQNDGFDSYNYTKE